MDTRPLDRLSLVAGLVFIVVGSVFFLERLGVIEVSPSFVLPVVLVALGIMLLVGRVSVTVGDSPPADVEAPYSPPPAVTEEVHPEPTLPETPPPSERPSDDR